MASSSPTVYFYSVITALMTGLASPSISTPIRSFLAHGTHGLGTFAHMDGEMVIIDGKAYQLKADGSLTKVDESKRVSFGVVAPYAPSAEQVKVVSSRVQGLKGDNGLGRLLEEREEGAGNHFLAFRLDGHFDGVKVRAIHAQDYKDEPLSELGKTQAVHSYDNLKGSLIGFRSPVWSGGFSVPGLHVHFIDDDRKVGGHVLEMDVKEGSSLGVIKTTKVEMELPDSKEFGAREVQIDEGGLKKVEG